MKKTTYFVAALALLGTLSFTSCRKCKECTATTTYEYVDLTEEDREMLDGLVEGVTTHRQEACGRELEAIDGITETAEMNTMGLTYRITTTYDCK